MYLWCLTPVSQAILDPERFAQQFWNLRAEDSTSWPRDSADQTVFRARPDNSKGGGGNSLSVSFSPWRLSSFRGTRRGGGELWGSPERCFSPQNAVGVFRCYCCRCCFCCMRNCTFTKSAPMISTCNTGGGGFSWKGLLLLSCNHISLLAATCFIVLFHDLHLLQYISDNIDVHRMKLLPFFRPTTL